ncbi:MAG: phosphoglucosamine mutase [Thermoplasmata archaeon]|nr:MAG: phosphoglucosamine mutase [Thermoplasmata archaeon]
MTRLFGTNGVRGIVNEDMNAELALHLGMAIGTFFSSPLAIATDTRTSNLMLKNAVISGLLSTGCNVYDAGIAPSPALQYYVKMNKVGGGVIITASHNPPEFNGIKVVDRDGTELAREKEKKIEEIYFQGKWKKEKWDKIGKVQEVDAIHPYIDAIVSSVDSEKIKKRNFTVVLDCGNGAGSLTAPYILSKCGCRVITLNSNPDGSFPGRNAEPLKENVMDLLTAVREWGADIGIAYDGDADRAIFVDENGEYIHGDKTLSIVAGYMVEKKGGIVVTPVSTSSCVEDFVKERGGKVVYTKVGAPIVARKMMEIKATFGGEENGGLIFPNHQYCRDAGMATVAILEIMALKKKTLSELVEEVPHYSLVKTKVKCKNERKKEVMQKFLQREKNKIDLTDGAKIYFHDGWVLVRPSGTEPIIRIYAEGKSEGRAREMVEEYKNKLEEIISQRD